MAYSIPIEILVSEVEWQLIKEYDLNLVEIAVEACRDAIQSRSLMHHAVNAATSRTAEITTLKAENERLKGALQERKTPKIEVHAVKTEAPKPKSPEQIYMKAAMKHQAIKKPMTVEDLYE